jgi:hypothetical protein
MTRQDLLDKMLAADAITRDEYDAAIRERAFPLRPRVPRGWRQLVYKAAGRGKLNARDVMSLERNHGGTE